MWSDIASLLKILPWLPTAPRTKYKQLTMTYDDLAQSPLHLISTVHLLLTNPNTSAFWLLYRYTGSLPGFQALHSLVSWPRIFFLRLLYGCSFSWVKSQLKHFLFQETFTHQFPCSYFNITLFSFPIIYQCLIILFTSDCILFICLLVYFLPLLVCTLPAARNLAGLVQSKTLNKASTKSITTP